MFETIQNVVLIAGWS